MAPLLAVISAAGLAAPSLIGVWQAQHDYGSGTYAGERVETPARFAPIRDVEHLVLYIQRAADGTLSAFIRNPEQNAGAALGMRTVVVDGTVVRLRRAGSGDVAGRWDAAADAIELQDPGLPGLFRFTRAATQPARPYAYRQPQRDGDGWRTGTLASAGIDERAISAIVRDIRATAPSLRAPYVQSLLIARHGRLVLDEYFNGYDASRPHDVRSAGKSVTALMVGRAIEDTRAFSPSTRISAILTQYEPFANDDARKEAITVGDLLSMSAGYACDDNDDASPGNEGTMQSQTRQPDWYKYTVDLPMLFAPGTRALYCTAEINLLGAIVARETRLRLTSYFDERFARPLGFLQYGMWVTPPPVSDAYMGGGDLFRPRDFLKFGQLFLDRGRWNGSAVIDPHWLAEASAKHSFIEGGSGDYGYGWHLYTYNVGGRAIRAINAGGNGGQLLYVFPQLDLAIMITAANYGQYPVWRTFQTQLVPRILRAVK